ncbi:unnamed protein product [Blepharisma stoltei]|uniref:USP domain-containing protein n=1 Tax=Blepharisma stoltei TaxID=1481888 RepID=A0AAU9JL10_9CILI|nr:unnamed protein product [Blepharisma stoltei]
MEGLRTRKRKNPNYDFVPKTKKLKVIKNSIEVCCLKCSTLYNKEDEHFCQCKTGLINIGNSCYINSVFQVFADLMVPLYITSDSQLGLMIKSLRSYSEQPISTEIVLTELDHLWEHKNVQEDAHEFFIAMLAAFNGSVFQFSTQSECFCESCNLSFIGDLKEDNTFHMMIDGSTLQEQINGSMEEILADCPNCTWPKLTCYKTIIKPPEILVVKMNRFQFNQTTGNASKVSSKVEIPQNVEIGTKRYSLSAVILHKSRSLRYGHYTTYFHRKKILIDDEVVFYNKTLKLDHAHFYIAFYS